MIVKKNLHFYSNSYSLLLTFGFARLNSFYLSITLASLLPHSYYLIFFIAVNLRIIYYTSSSTSVVPYNCVTSRHYFLFRDIPNMPTHITINIGK